MYRWLLNGGQEPALILCRSQGPRESLCRSLSRPCTAPQCVICDQNVNKMLDVPQ